MSFFKDKDHFITNAFDKLFNQDSEDSGDETDQLTSIDETDNITSIDDSLEESRPKEVLKKQEHIELTISDEDSNSNVLNKTTKKVTSNKILTEFFDDIIKNVRQDSGQDNSVILVEDSEESNPIEVIKPSEDVVLIDDEDDDDDDGGGDSFCSPNKKFKATTSTREDSFTDPDDYNFNLKLTLAGSYQQFPTTYKTRLVDTLKCLLDELSKKEEGLIIQRPSGENISMSESPYSLKLSPGDILKAIEISLNDRIRTKSNDCDSKSNPDEILVKVQDGNRKNTKEFRILKNLPLIHLKDIYAKELNIDSLERIKFTFDGDQVSDESTPEELEIEDDCVIDVVVAPQ